MTANAIQSEGTKTKHCTLLLLRRNYRFLRAPDNFEIFTFESRHGCQQPIKSRYDDDMDNANITPRVPTANQIVIKEIRGCRHVHASDRCDHEHPWGVGWDNLGFRYLSFRTINDDRKDSPIFSLPAVLNSSGRTIFFLL